MSPVVMTMDAMTSLGELGVVITFLKASFRATSLDVLASLIFGFLDRFHLKACLQLRTELHQKNYSSVGIVTPLEDELLFRVATMNGRFAERGPRMFINYEHASLMLKNMPIEDDFKMARARQLSDYSGRRKRKIDITSVGRRNSACVKLYSNST